MGCWDLELVCVPYWWSMGCWMGVVRYLSGFNKIQPYAYGMQTWDPEVFCIDNNIPRYLEIPHRPSQISKRHHCDPEDWEGGNLCIWLFGSPKWLVIPPGFTIGSPVSSDKPCHEYMWPSTVAKIQKIIKQYVYVRKNLRISVHRNFEDFVSTGSLLE